MTDVVERLRIHKKWPVEVHDLALEAADEIEHVKALLHCETLALNDAQQRINEQATEIERLRKENFGLAAYQCTSPSGDEYGNMRCAEIERLRELLLKIEAMANFEATTYDRHR